MYFKVYAIGLKGWEYLTTVYSEEAIDDVINNLNPKIYKKVLVIQHDVLKQEDSIYISKEIEGIRTRRLKHE